MARAIGAGVSDWTGDPNCGWQLDIGTLRQKLTPKTRAVVVTFPHNPTGFLPTAAFLDELVELSRNHGFILFSDEVYRGLELDPSDRLPAAADLDDRAVSLGVMSKAFGLAGLRIGWIASRNHRLLRDMASFKDYTTICSAGPSEFLATLALRHMEKLLNRNRTILAENLVHLDAFFQRFSDNFLWESPKAGPIALVRLPENTDVDLFCSDVLEKSGVLLLPGTLYDAPVPAFRIGFGRRNLPDALVRMAKILE